MREEPPGDPESLRRAASALGGEAVRGFEDVSNVLSRIVPDVVAADWNGPASRSWATSTFSLQLSASEAADAAREAGTVLNALAAKIEAAKERASRATGRIDRATDVMTTMAQRLSELASEDDPDPQTKARLKGRKSEASGNLTAATTELADAVEDAKRAARLASRRLSSLTRDLPEFVTQLSPAVPVTPSPDLAEKFLSGSGPNIFLDSPLLANPGDVRRRQIQDDLARDEAERERQEGGFVDAAGGEFEGFVGFRLFGNEDSEAYKGGKGLGTFAGVVPTPGSFVRLIAKQGGKRVAKKGGKEGVEEAGERSAKKGAGRRARRRAERDAMTPEERRVAKQNGWEDIIKQAGEGLGNADVGEQTGSMGKVLALLAHEEIRILWSTKIYSEAARIRRLKRVAEREIAKIRVAREFAGRPRGVPGEAPRTAPQEQVRRR